MRLVGGPPCLSWTETGVTDPLDHGPLQLRGGRLGRSDAGPALRIAPANPADPGGRRIRPAGAGPHGVPDRGHRGPGGRPGADPRFVDPVAAVARAGGPPRRAVRVRPRRRVRPAARRPPGAARGRGAVRERTRERHPLRRQRHRAHPRHRRRAARGEPGPGVAGPRVQLRRGARRHERHRHRARRRRPGASVRARALRRAPRGVRLYRGAGPAPRHAQGARRRRPHVLAPRRRHDDGRRRIGAEPTHRGDAAGALRAA